MRLRFAAAAAVVVVCSAAMLAQVPGPRRDGNWEVNMQIEMPGMPKGIPPITTAQCITKEEAADPQKSLPQGPGGRGTMPSDCKVSDYKTSGNTVSWSMKCGGDTPMSGTGEFVYAGETYTGTMKINVERGGQSMPMTLTYSGKRLGDCTK